MAVKPKTLPPVTVQVAGQRKKLSETSILVYGATIQSLAANTGTQYIGDETVTSNNGHPFGPDDTVEVDPPPSSKGQEQFDLSEVYVDSSTSGAQFRISAWIRK